MAAFLELRQLYCAFWVECVWIIADASKSDTKFLVSDNPVSIYNRGYGPRNQKYSGVDDPEVWLNGSQTIYPLSSERVLMMTNLSWVRNPYQDPRKPRPNPYPFRDSIMMLDGIQTHRYLTEEEVRQINFIIKTGAYRFIAAGNEEWLYPEEHVARSEWPRMQHGYLCMPDPRAVGFSGPIYIGFKGGGSTAFDEYGRRPWQREFSSEYDSEKEKKQFDRFRKEFAELFGPNRRGMSGGPLGGVERDFDWNDETGS